MLSRVLQSKHPDHHDVDSVVNSTTIKVTQAINASVVYAIEAKHTAKLWTDSSKLMEIYEQRSHKQQKESNRDSC